MTSKGIERIYARDSIRQVVRTTALVIFIAVRGFFLQGAGANLVDNSPFIPDSFNARQQAKKPLPKKAASAVLEFEFRGVYSLGGEYQFSIYNKKSQKGEWVSLGESGSSFEVTSYDENSNSIQLNIDGKIEEMALRTPDNKPIPVQTARSGTTKSRKELAAANRAARAKKKKPVVRRRVIVPNRKAPAANQSKYQAKPTHQRQQFPGNTQRKNYKTPKEAQDLLKELQNRRNRSPNKK